VTPSGSKLLSTIGGYTGFRVKSYQNNDIETISHTDKPDTLSKSLSRTSYNTQETTDRRRAVPTLQRANKGHSRTELVQQPIGGVHVVARIADGEEMVGVGVTVDVVEFDHVGIVGHGDSVDGHSCGLETSCCRLRGGHHGRVAVRNDDDDVVNTETVSVKRRKLHTQQTITKRRPYIHTCRFYAYTPRPSLA